MLSARKVSWIQSTIVLIATFIHSSAFNLTSWTTNGCSKSNDSVFIRWSGMRPSADYLHKVADVRLLNPSECFLQCAKDDTCSGYIVNSHNASCFLMVRGLTPAVSHNFLQDTKSGYYWKTCITSVDCKEREWAFEIMSGMQLFKYEDKTVGKIKDFEKCLELCSTERTFSCRSARFEPHLSRCILSRHDRRTAPEHFRRSTNPRTTYIERNCLPEPSSCHFRPSLTFQSQHVQEMEEAQTREQCEALCAEKAPFICRAYMFSQNSGKTHCFLSPDDSLIDTSSNSTVLHNETDIFEKESCIETEVICGAHAMSAVIKVSTPFRGRIYAVGHPYDCYSVRVDPEGRLRLDLPLSGKQCGTLNLGNGTYINSVVVQHHPLVLRTSDRRVDVTCDYPQLKGIKIRGAKAAVNGFSRYRAPDLQEEPTIVAEVVNTPPVRLRVVDENDRDISGAQLGDPLFLKVELADESVYGIFGSELVARSSSGLESILLINNNGCPVEPTVLPSLQRMSGSKNLVAPFQAFKFATDDALKFQMTVAYCVDACIPAECATERGHNSYGRRRRRKRKAVAVQPGEVVADVMAESVPLIVTSEPGDRKLLHSPQFLEQSVRGGPVLIEAKTEICMSFSTIYASVSCAGLLQLLLICAAIMLGKKCSSRKQDRSFSSQAFQIYADDDDDGKKLDLDESLKSSLNG